MLVVGGIVYQERRRQELLTLRVTAAHKSVTEAYRALQSDVTAAAEQAMAATRMSLHEERKALDAEIERLGELVAEGKDENRGLEEKITEQARQMVVLQSTVIQREERIKVLEEQAKIRTEKTAEDIDHTIDESFARVHHNLKLPMNRAAPKTGEEAGEEAGAGEGTGADPVEEVDVEQVGKK